MIFVSYWFIVFALVVFPLYWLARNLYLRLATLAVACVVFHTHFAGPAGVVPIIVLAVATYCIGLARNRHLCIAGMLLCAGALIFYKYTTFFTIRVIGAISPDLGAQLHANAQTLLPLAPPLAISFFVFEFVHYLFEVRRGHKPIKNPLHFGLFAIFWPTIVAGPIKRYGDFIPSLMAGVSCVAALDVAVGLLRVAAGLVKKGLADNLTIWIDYHAPRFETLSMFDRWVFFVALAFRIYLDFSGYSDMAIGYARMMGIRIPENFNWPYLSRSIDDFWRRWHISLSSWIRDYIYIPLGGNRYGLPRKILNGLIAFSICGLWHGADWNFLIWGLYHGLGLAVCANYERSFGSVGRGVARTFRAVPALGWLVTFGFVSVGWLFFFYQLPDALRMLKLLVRP